MVDGVTDIDAVLPMTKEAFIEAVVEKAHEAWALKEQGKLVDLTICLGRKDRWTGQVVEPTVNVLVRGRLEG